MPLFVTSISPMAASPSPAAAPALRRRASAGVRASAVGGFPAFLPKAVERIRDPRAIELARRIERVPVETSFSKSPILSSCVKPHERQSAEPVVLLHGFDSSCLEWRYTYPLLEDAGVETWAVDVLGWGFCNLDALPPCNVAAKREHLYEFWRSHIGRPMVLVGASLGAAVAIDFAVHFPKAVSKLIFIDASVHAAGTGDMAKLPKFFAYAGVLLLKSLPLRLYATRLAFSKIPDGSYFDWVNIGRLHCLLPWWADATVDFMISGGYNVLNQMKQVEQKCLIIWGEDDAIVSNKQAYRLHHELPNSVLRQIPQCGHVPHVEKPDAVTRQILDFLGRDKAERTVQAAFVPSQL